MQRSNGRHVKFDNTKREPSNIGSHKDKISYLHSGLAAILASLLLIACPVFAMIFVYILVDLGGDIGALYSRYQTQGMQIVLRRAIFDHLGGTLQAWKIIGSFALFELVLMRVLPGKTVKGPITPNGNIPEYKANGLLAYFVTLTVFFTLAYLGIVKPTEIYDNYLDVIGALNVASLGFVLVLYLKGRFAPSSSDCSVSGNFMFDYFWGTELYPRILGWDVKMFTNCRFGLKAWTLLPIVYAWKQCEEYGLTDSMLVCVGLQLVYLAKFYHWEMGYMKSLDIMHDRAGFYICWGCLVWVPSVYTSPALYLVHNPIQLGIPVASFIFVTGVIMIFLNYHADYQRELVRSTDGKCTIWGSKPVLIRATYVTKKNETKQSILLASGWWGVSRHFHYIPEILAAFCWSAPALFGSFLPYFYFCMLVILLTHRSVRDDKRCREKYQQYWTAYCLKVPYKILPYVF